MSLRNLPVPRIEAPSRPVNFEPSPAVMAHFNGGLRLEAAADENVISILGVIGGGEWGDGTSPRRVQQRLNEIGRKPVTVHLNSPGGVFFDGLAIFNMLRLHPAEVTVNVLGIAASAASLVAMAGDKIAVPKSGWFMIHNTQAIALGDRHTFADMVRDLEKFDAVLAAVYADRTGGDVKKISALLDAETFLSGEEAVKLGFADSILEGAKVEDAGEGAGPTALRELESILLARGMPRAERREFFKRLFAGKPSADGDEEGKPSAARVSVSSDALDSLRAGISSLVSAGNSLNR